MQTHIIFCHPSQTSFGAHILEHVRTGLREEISSGEVTEVQLYEQGFDPVMSPSEFERYEDPSSLRGLEAIYAQQLESANHLILVFPVWVFGPPSLLKGYFEKIWRPGVTCRLVEGGVEPLLTRLHQITVLCTFGQPRESVLERADPIHDLFKRLKEQSCAERCELTYLPCYGCDELDHAEGAAYLAKITARLKAVASAATGSGSGEADAALDRK